MHQDEGLLFQHTAAQNLGIMVRQKNKKSDDELFIIECIVDRRRIESRLQYLVKWKDYPSSHNTWEDASNIAHCREIVAEFREHRVHEGFNDSDNDEDLIPPVPPPKKRRTRRKKLTEDNPEQPETATIQEENKPQIVLKNSVDSASVSLSPPNHVVNLASATEIVGASYSESSKFFCVQFVDESKYWISNDECRKHLPQMLLDFYEHCTIFMTPTTDQQQQEQVVPKKEPKTRQRRKKQPPLPPQETTDFEQPVHVQDRDIVNSNTSSRSVDDYQLDSSSSIMEQPQSYMDDGDDLIIEESTETLPYSPSLDQYGPEADVFHNSEFFDPHPHRLT